MSLLHLDLPAEPPAIARAREALDVLAPTVGPAVIPDLRLLVSEVVTNAVRHADTAHDARVLLTVDVCPGCLRIEVHDGGAGFRAPADPQPRPEATGGWGLFLVQRLASRWGTEPSPGAHVWFELALGHR